MATKGCWWKREPKKTTDHQAWEWMDLLQQEAELRSNYCRLQCHFERSGYTLVFGCRNILSQEMIWIILTVGCNVVCPKSQKLSLEVELGSNNTSHCSRDGSAASRLSVGNKLPRWGTPLILTTHHSRSNSWKIWCMHVKLMAELAGIQDRGRWLGW